MTEKLAELVQLVKLQLRKDVCSKYHNCKGCPIKDTFEVDICDFVALYDVVEEKHKEKEKQKKQLEEKETGKLSYELRDYRN